MATRAAPSSARAGPGEHAVRERARNGAAPTQPCRMAGVGCMEARAPARELAKSWPLKRGRTSAAPRTAKPSQADPCAGASKEPLARAKEVVRTASRPRRKAPQERTSPSCKERSQAGRSRAALERALYPGGRPLYEEEVEALLNTPEPFSFWWDVVVPIALLCLAIWQPVLLVHLIIDCIAPNPTQPTRPASRHATH